jgi:hypothetical protein
MDAPPAHVSLSQVFTSASEIVSILLSRHFMGSSEHSWGLAAAVLALSRIEGATAEMWHQLQRYYRKARWHCLNVRSETPLYWAIGAALSRQRGRQKRAAQLLNRAEALAKKQRNADGLLFSYRLGLRMYSVGSKEHRRYVELEASLLQQMKALPQPSFNQILKGHLGPGLWDEIEDHP